MKWSVSELNRGPRVFHFKYELDLSTLVENDDDIIKIDPVIAKGSFTLLDVDVLEFNYKIETTLYLPCAITLKEVPYKVNEWVTDVYTKELFDGNSNLEGDYLDLSEMIYANLLILKPIRVVSDDSVEFNDETERQVNESFRQLENFFKGDK